MMGDSKKAFDAMTKYLGELADINRKGSAQAAEIVDETYAESGTIILSIISYNFV